MFCGIDEFFSKYVDYTAKVNEPVLVEGMIPVIWENGKWKRVEQTDDDWYAYGTSSDTKKCF